MAGWVKFQLGYNQAIWGGTALRIDYEGGFRVGDSPMESTRIRKKLERELYSAFPGFGSVSRYSWLDICSVLLLKRSGSM